MQEISSRFQEGCGFPGVVGAIDGTHINIPTPKEDAGDYLNRKRFHSVVLQVIQNFTIFLWCGHLVFLIPNYQFNLEKTHTRFMITLSVSDEYIEDITNAVDPHLCI